ncbi:shikimate dehydrogenase [Hymenobacter sp. ASUV-10]|uniref:Shikimate dehydrogenase n=1 Tax=Hymenobacter aranciens TaxID=3063996 RepID=A0ABT9BAQ1_9BACT|nr:shikimate dehydrogenase [Hymenobacter sp. ASUV-10]MDO7875267.1 shikimate dehydrogenase [Hymenobacter sp. ASUV-10]
MRQFGLIGRTLRHSFSQAYFTQKFAALGLENHHYELFELADIAELPALLAAHPHLEGLNVTVPYKELVMPYLDELTPTAARVGAVNVIQRRPDGRLIGHNTDYIGFRESLRRFYPLRGEEGRALVLGQGGAAKAIAVVLRDLDIPHQFATRNPLGDALSYDDLTPQLLSQIRLIINATPLGTFPNAEECPRLPYPALTPQHYLYDVVYNPAETLFMRKGLAAGAQVKNGFEMLRLQAEASWEIWND